MNTHYFESPTYAVIVVNQLLEKRAWSTLAKYYHLDASGPKLEELTSGRFFYTTESSGPQDPMGFWKYRHPFPPGFAYDSHEELNNDILKVHVAIDVLDEPLPGAPPDTPAVMRTVRAFHLHYTAGRGFKLLPDQVEP